jgi:hypothetical protein
MWRLEFDVEFRAEFRDLDLPVRKVIAAYVKLLDIDRPRLGRPHADTLKGSAHRNMKELRLTVNRVEWRVAYAFDPDRTGIVLAAAPKGASKRAYKALLAVADRRFSDHLGMRGRKG